MHQQGRRHLHKVLHRRPLAFPLAPHLLHLVPSLGRPPLQAVEVSSVLQPLQAVVEACSEVHLVSSVAVDYRVML
jgi:hypothetical protein